MATENPIVTVPHETWKRLTCAEVVLKALSLNDMASPAVRYAAHEIELAMQSLTFDGAVPLRNEILLPALEQGPGGGAA